MKRKSLLIMLLMAMFAPLAFAQQALPYEYSFEDNDLTIDGWTTSDLSNGGILNLYSSTSSPHYYVFAFNYTSNPPQYLISPELTGTEDGVTVEFEYAVYKTTYGNETFQVGYSTTTNATSSFTWDSEITASNGIGDGASWLTYSKTFPAGTKYVAVKHTSNDVWYLFVDEFSFTAPDLCGTPSNLVSSDVTTSSATLTWEGLQDTYTVRYRTAPSVEFFEGFEDGIPDTWTLIDNDGDGNNWSASNAGAYEGSYCATSASYASSALTPDNWLCTPQLALNGTMKVWLKAQDPEWADEHFAIYLTTANAPTVRNFTSGTTLVAETVATGEYVEYTYDLSSYNGQMGYIAIRHFNCTDMFRLNVDNFGLYGAEFSAGAWQTVSVNGTTTTISSLTSETGYEWQVQGNCASGTTEWSAMAHFTTPSACDTPTNLTVSNITDNSADFTWTGYQDSYNFRYRSLEVSYSADFSNGIPEGWTTIDSDGDGNDWNAGDGYVYSESYINNVGALTPDNWLITGQITLGNLVNVTAFGTDASYSAEHFAVYVSTSGTNVRDFTQVSEEFIATGDASEYSADLSNYAGQMGYIAIRHFNVTDMYRLAVSGLDVYTAGSWTTLSNATAPFALNNLAGSTVYETQVQGICSNGETEWSESLFFETATGNIFLVDGNWNVASNWKNNAVPAEGEDVTINANCIIPAGYTANAGAITIGENGSLTIQDGGQLIHTNEGVVATMEKEIKGYTGEKDSYYFISSPANTVFTDNGNTYWYTDPAEVENMLSNEYDLYGFDCTEELEWRNYEADAENFVMWQGMGYLYANSGEKTTLKFTGELIPFESTFANNYSLLTYEASDENFNGFNLVGNMFAADAYIVIANYESGITGLAEDVYFYTMGDGELVAGTGAVAPMQGVMVQASSDSQVALCYTQALRSNKALNINLSNSHGLLDAAYIRFNGGSELSKIQLNPNHTKVFFTKDNQDYAVVNSEAQGEMPVSFKAENNDTYTLSFNTENVELGYLHLIDNMTGNDVDLLSNPSYTFEAKSTDYANRFKLVFATGNADDNFAFYSNGSFVINNEGNAMLQVMDVTGRIISSESINGCTNLNVNAALGVYMLRLVNGDNVKVQKVVVK